MSWLSWKRRDYGNLLCLSSTIRPSSMSPASFAGAEADCW